jgi:hypothetical protein
LSTDPLGPSARAYGPAGQRTPGVDLDSEVNLKLIAMIIVAGGALVTVVTMFKLLGAWAALLLLFVIVFGATRH